MANPNDGYKLNATREGRDLAARLKPKKFKNLTEWSVAFEQTRLQNAAILAEIVKFMPDLLEVSLTTAKLILECPTTNDRLALKAADMVVKVSREMNQLIYNQLRQAKQAGIEPVTPAPSNLPPDFTQ